jgi:anti-anti-sigma factor
VAQDRTDSPSTVGNTVLGIVSRSFPARRSAIPEMAGFVHAGLAELGLPPDQRAAVDARTARALLEAASAIGTVRISIRVFADGVEIDVLRSDDTWGARPADRSVDHRAASGHVVVPMPRGPVGPPSLGHFDDPSPAADPAGGPVPLRVRTALVGATARLRLAGEIDMDDADWLSAQINEHLADATIRRVVVDLAGVTYLQSSGLRTFAHARRRAGETRKVFYIENAPAQIARVMAIAGMYEYLTQPATFEGS